MFSNTNVLICTCTVSNVNITLLIYYHTCNVQDLNYHLNQNDTHTSTNWYRHQNWRGDQGHVIHNTYIYDLTIYYTYQPTCDGTKEGTA